MIKPKTGNCLDCGNQTMLIAKRCQYCYWKFRNNAKQSIQKLVKKAPIKPLSKKRKQENAVYLKKKCNFMLEHKYCEAKINNCSKYATDVHHKKGRIGNLLLDERYFLAVCRSCHSWIELNPIEAKELGFSVSRLEK